MSQEPGILDGLRVVDLAQGLAGRAATRYLAEAGADVVRISRPGACEPGTGTLFRVLDRGKHPMALDPADAPGLKRLHALLAAADVLVHDFTPAQARALGLDDAALAALNPRLVFCAIGGWPQRHARADDPVAETLVLARLGLLDEQPGHRDGPVFIRMPFAGWIASWLGAVGVMARLIARDRSGTGGAAHTSLAQAALVPMTMHWSRAQRPSPVFAQGLPKSTPIPLHQASDGQWIHVHYSPDAAPWMAQALAAMGPEAVAAENAKYPPSHVAPNFGANKAIIATRPAQEWVRHFWEHDVAAQIAAPFGAIYADEQARANGYIAEVEDPVLGPTLQPGPAVHVEPPCRVQVRATAFDVDVPWPFPSALPTPAPEAGRACHAQPPLHGLKVLDLGAYLAGPFACMLLADLGAEVVKVEPPSGDAMRRLERIFAGTQRGKRALALRLGTPQAQPVLQALVRQADVVHHNIRMPAARKLGIAPQQLRALKPELVCAHVSSYGPHGPRADWPGFDQLMQAACGWELEGGGKGNPPMWLRFGVGDHLAAGASVFAVLLGLYRKTRTGQGQAVAASLLGAMLTTVAEAVALSDGSITPIAHLDQDQAGIAPTHRLYRCADAWMAVAAFSPQAVAAFERVAGSDPQAHFSRLTQAQALASLDAARVPAAPVLQAQGEPFLDDPAHAAAGLHARYIHAEYGELQQVGALWDFRDLPLSLHLAPPALGEHSEAVLRELELDQAAIDALVQAGITRCRPATAMAPTAKATT
ncbi:CoA transferase [Azohydromonas lata]|uniref:CoA transferase n=1 Tax=Azohydromonas lata TaxID=45677 RepID=UPI00082BEF87|nr:CoA transferase [Azohydromonas lata]